MRLWHKSLSLSLDLLLLVNLLMLVTPAGQQPRRGSYILIRYFVADAFKLQMSY